jgi:cation/acetate symporter
MTATFTFAAIGDPSAVAIVFFATFIVLALGVAYWAAKRTRTTEQFYAAGHSITGFQNGVALAGDYMSAASFLGIAGLVALFGFDGLIYSVGWLVGWPIVLFLIAEPLRNLGKYTFADVVAFRLKQKPVRLAAAFGTLTVVILYLIAQMVGAGTLIKLMFGFDYSVSVIIVGAVMITLLLLGGMVATTWVQIIKACLLLGGAFVLTLLVLGKFSFNPLDLFQAATETETATLSEDKTEVIPGPAPGDQFLAPGEKVVTGATDAVSLGLALMLGTAGLPHILMRFYTVPNTVAARTSVAWATFFIGTFYLMTFVIGFGAMTLVGQSTILGVDAAGNMSAPLLAQELGGEAFLGFIAAVAFATILAVVAGLTLAGAAALSHDVWTNVVRGGHSPEHEQLLVARSATVVMGITAVILGIVLEGQNVAFMVGLAFAVAASANFPALLLSIFWRRLTTAGTVASIIVGTISALVLIYLSPTIQVDVLENEDAPFSLRNPALITVPLAFAVAIVVSLFTKETDAMRRFQEAERQIHLGSVAPPEPEVTPPALPAAR